MAVLAWSSAPPLPVNQSQNCAPQLASAGCTTVVQLVSSHDASGVTTAVTLSAIFETAPVLASVSQPQKSDPHLARLGWIESVHAFCKAVFSPAATCPNAVSMVPIAPFG